MREAKIIVELGTGMGNSTSAFLSVVHLTDGKVYSIDHKLISEVLDRFEKDRNDGFIEFIEGDSADLADLWNHGQIDVLLVDSDHSYGHVKKELEKWVPYVATSGIIFVHDIYDINDQITETWRR